MRVESTWRRARWAAVIAACALAAGCGPTTVDPSSVPHLRQSLADLREPLTPPELASFEEALSYLVGRDSLQTLALQDIDRETAQPLLELFRPLGGRTVDGVVAEARFLRTREVRSAVTSLQQWRDSTAEARRDLQRFRFEQARVFKRHRGYLEWPVIEMKVKNGTGHHISLIRIRATLLEPGHDEPWLEEDFDHLVLGGLAPGEEAVWRIEPEQQEWIRLIDPHPELRFTLEAMRLVALGGKVLVESDWGAREDHKLATFLGTLEVIRASGTLAPELPPRAFIPALGAPLVQMVTGAPSTATAAPPENG